MVPAVSQVSDMIPRARSLLPVVVQDQARDAVSVLQPIRYDFAAPLAIPLRARPNPVIAAHLIACRDGGRYSKDRRKADAQDAYAASCSRVDDINKNRPEHSGRCVSF